MEHPETLRILVVDDNESFRMILAVALGDMGRYSVESCATGEEALVQLKQHTFDVTLLDCKLPGLSGFDVLRWMQESQIDTPVIIMTAAGESLESEALRLGAYAYLRKEGIDLGHLPVMINEAHQRHLLAREKQEIAVAERLQERDLASVASFRSTMDEIGHFINTSLSVLSMNIEDHERWLHEALKGDDLEHSARELARIRQEIRTLSSGVKSLLSLTALINEKLFAAHESTGMEHLLR